MGKKVYAIPCEVVPKGIDPHGRIIHDYGFVADGINSVNTALANDSVEILHFRTGLRSCHQ